MDIANNLDRSKYQAKNSPRLDRWRLSPACRSSTGQLGIKYDKYGKMPSFVAS
jgi:hypothetical protein